MNLAYKNTALIEELGCVFFHDYFIRIDCPEEKKMVVSCFLPV